MARRMADRRFRDAQWLGRYADHIAPINRLVDELRNSERGWLPYVAPMYGGVNARLLSVLRDPGPMTQAEAGSGFLSMENDDATAETISLYFATVRIPAQEIVPWNAYPWYINRTPNASELKAGIEPFKRLIELLPNLCVIMLHGVSAHDSWKRFSREYPYVIAQRQLHVIPTYHTSRQAFWHRDPVVREARKAHLQRAFAEAAQSLQLTNRYE